MKHINAPFQLPWFRLGNHTIKTLLLSTIIHTPTQMLKGTFINNNWEKLSNLPSSYTATHVLSSNYELYALSQKDIASYTFIRDGVLVGDSVYKATFNVPYSMVQFPYICFDESDD